ncbi:phosphocholine-specific phospholipase C [Tsukamurella pseudospumae]|uniref:phosphocholine-specific phospholipase C n=1 Tax=Tsukamurella pseudospumae TaxID=239498 RepID=UPI000AA06B43|nr:phospholipase C, phosphocholine-specific [Tsukamurella pseudospumae]
MSTATRRAFLRGAGAGGIVAGMGLLPSSLTEALARPAPSGGLDGLEHVILLMQENRSFDHYYGTLSGVRGFGDPAAIRLRSGHSVFEQPTRSGLTVPPFPVRSAAHRQGMDAENIDALDHTWKGGQAALAGGWHDGWIAAKTDSTMAYYDRADIPFHYALADAFTICDHYYCSSPTSTSPNRNFFFSGTTGFEPRTGERAVENTAYDRGHPGYDWPCIGEILQRAGVDWQVYQEWDNFTDNNIEFFRRFKTVSQEVFRDFGTEIDDFYQGLRRLPADEAHRRSGEVDARARTLPQPDRDLFFRGLRRTATGTLTDRIAADIAAGTLPTVSYVVASERESEHPSGSSPRASANLVHRILDALGRHPETWRKTALFLLYDENDGYFDHVPPPRPPRDSADEWVGDLPLGLGNRVPMTVVSPWTVGGYVASETFDHTSTLRFLERWLGIEVPSISPWRRTVCGDLTSAFDFRAPQPLPAAGRPQPQRAPAPRWKPHAPAVGVRPAQEPGVRPARLVPYVPGATVVPGPDGVRLRLTNTGSRSAHFTVFPYHAPDSEPLHADVLGSVELTVPGPAGRYDLLVLGPAGEHWTFVSDAGAGPNAAAG